VTWNGLDVGLLGEIKNSRYEKAARAPGADGFECWFTEAMRILNYIYRFARLKTRQARSNQWLS